jgi:acyl dehydratase
MKFFDDLKIGERYEVGSYSFTAENIKSFARRFDPQPFHLDEQAAAKSHFGALCASGWQTVIVWMPLMLAYRQRLHDEMRARGEIPPVIGPAPGLNGLKWLKPVYAGDTVTYVTEIASLRRSQSRPEWGLTSLTTSGTNQRGEAVVTFTNISFVPLRSPA